MNLKLITFIIALIGGTLCLLGIDILHFSLGLLGVSIVTFAIIIKVVYIDNEAKMR